MTDIYTPAFFAEHHQTTALSASAVVPIVMEQLSPKSVLDLGCGGREWLDVFQHHGAITFGVDIAAPEAQLRHDLTTPLDLGRTFDLVISLETAEHLPEEAADTYVENIVVHAADAVLFSGAVPGQEGLNHINCQPHEYWHEKFESHGFQTTDTIRPLIPLTSYVSQWYRENIFLYRR